MSWFSQYIGDPLKALLAEAEAGADADLKALAGQVAAGLPAAPISATVETDFTTALQGAADTAITGALGEVPVAGAVMTPEAKTAANAAIDYLVTKGTAALNSLAAEAKARLTAVASSAGVAPGTVGETGTVA